MNQYLIFPKDCVEDSYEDGSMFRVLAKNKKEALNKFANVFYKFDKIFLEDVYIKSVNMSFAEKFFFQTDIETKTFCETGKVLINENEFKKRVKLFFDKNEKYSEIYLNYYLNESDEKTIFPDEMLLFMWKKSEENSFNFTIFDLGKISVIK
jgi:hypothetical protein